MIGGRRLVETRSGAVHVWTRDGRGIPLLLLHMSPRSGKMYRPFIDCSTRPVAAPDRPGFGYSDPLPDEPTMSRYAEATLDVVDALGWDTFDVVGTHTGSVEAIELAHRVPERVRGLGLVSIPSYSIDEVAERMNGVAAPRPRPRRDGSHLVAMWSRRVAVRRRPVDLDHLQRLFVDELISAASAHLAYRAVLAYPTEARLRSLERPVTLLMPHDDLLDQTRRALPALPDGSDIVELPHLDFDLWSEAPDELIDLASRLATPANSVERRSTDS